MKITGLIFGTSGTLTKDMLKEDELEKVRFKITLPLNASMKKRIESIFLESLPSGVEHTLVQIKEEHQILDLPVSDAYVVFPFQLFHDRWLHALYSHNKPVVIAPLPYSEIFSYGNVYYPYFLRDTREIDSLLKVPHRVYLSKDKNDLSVILRSLYVKDKISKTNALCIGEPMYEPFHSHDWGYAMVRAVQEKFGLKWIQMSSQSFLQRWEEWKKKDVDIKDLKGTVRRVHYTGDRQLIEAKRMYLLLKSIIEEKRADAFTINCLASIILSKLDITPCYALSRLNDEGIVSACESDTTTLLDMLITVYASDSPGFMANPYLFPADNRVLLSHCTSPTLHSYREKKKDRFDIYPYFDHPSDQAVAPQVFKDYKTVTVTGLSENQVDRMLIIKGKIKRNTYFSTCRTQVEISVDSEVKDIAKDYQGRHWIMVYGDHSKIIQRVNDTLGIESIVYL